MSKHGKGGGPRSTAAPYEGRAMSITLTHAQRDAFAALLATGLFGFTRAALVRRLLDAQLQALAEHGWLALPPKPKLRGPR